MSKDKTKNSNKSEYESRLTDIDNSFFLTLNELKISMPKHFMNPNIDAYNVTYTKDMQHLNDAQTKLFILKNEIEKAILNETNNIDQITTQINTLKKNNNKLKEKTKNFALNDNASVGMLHDTTELYNKQKSGNWLFIIAILLSISYYYKSNN